MTQHSAANIHTFANVQRQCALAPKDINARSRWQSVQAIWINAVRALLTQDDSSWLDFADLLDVKLKLA